MEWASQCMYHFPVKIWYIANSRHNSWPPLSTWQLLPFFFFFLRKKILKLNRGPTCYMHKKSYLDHVLFLHQSYTKIKSYLGHVLFLYHIITSILHQDILGVRPMCIGPTYMKPTCMSHPPYMSWCKIDVR